MPAPYKFWRVVFSGSSNGSGAFDDIWLDEVSFRDASGTDLCVGGTPFASSNYAGGSYDRSLAFDKTTSTNGWSSLQGQWPCWIGYEFDSPVDVHDVVLTLPDHASALDELPVKERTHTEYSSDGITYYPLFFGFWVGNITVGGTATFTPQRTPAVPALLPDMLDLRSGRSLTDFSSPHAESLPDMQAAIKPLAHGPGRVAGTLKVLSAPAARAVRLHDRRTGQLLRHTVSASNGTYSFESLQLGRPYLVVGLDDAGQPAMYNAAVADMVEAGQ